MTKRSKNFLAQGAFTIITLLSARAHSACSLPTANAGELAWDTGTLAVRYCDGTNWKSTAGTRLTSCAGTTVGTITFDGATYKFCNGTYWYQMKGNSLGGCTTTDGTMEFNSGTSKMRYCLSGTFYDLATTTCIAYVTASNASYTLPASWNPDYNSIELIGGGGGGGMNASSGGGGGGSYAKKRNLNIAASTAVKWVIGAGGDSAGNGGDSYFCNSTASCATSGDTAVVVRALAGGSGTATGGGPMAGSNLGDAGFVFSGGTGGVDGGNTGGGGGGAAGPLGTGGNGNAQAGGQGGNGSGGTGGPAEVAGNNGTEYTAAYGSGGGGGGGASTGPGGTAGAAGGNYGAGGGGGGKTSAGGVGRAGLLVITYNGGTTGGIFTCN